MFNKLHCHHCETETAHVLVSSYRGPDRAWARVHCERCGEEREELRAVIEEAPLASEDETAVDKVRYHVHVATEALQLASATVAGIGTTLHHDHARALVATVASLPALQGATHASAAGGLPATPVAGTLQSPQGRSREDAGASAIDGFRAADATAPPGSVAPHNNESLALPPRTLRRAKAYSAHLANLNDRSASTDDWTAGYCEALRDIMHTVNESVGPTWKAQVTAVTKFLREHGL